MPQPKHTSGYNVLSIDGSSGFRSLSQIIQLDEYLKTIPAVHEKEGVSPRPCEHFDLIGGTSVGGLLAIMFGPLEMSCDEVKNAYIRMGRRIYVEGQGTGPPTIRQDVSLREELGAELMRLLEGRSGEILKSSRVTKCFVGFQCAKFSREQCNLTSCLIDLRHRGFDGYYSNRFAVPLAHVQHPKRRNIRTA